MKWCLTRTERWRSVDARLGVGGTGCVGNGSGLREVGTIRASESEGHCWASTRVTLDGALRCFETQFSCFQNGYNKAHSRSLKTDR